MTPAVGTVRQVQQVQPTEQQEKRVRPTKFAGVEARLDKLIDAQSRVSSVVSIGVRASKVFDQLAVTAEAIALLGALSITQKMTIKAIFMNATEAEYFVDFLSDDEERLAWVQEKLFS
jgi:hypothetical protein